MKKILIVIVALLCSLLAFAGCSGNKYHAVLYSHAEEWLSDKFLKENRVKAYYLNDDYIEGTTETTDKYIHDKASPISRTIIISEQSQYDANFTANPFEINFENEIILLYIFGDIYPNRDYKLKKIYSDGQTLYIQFKLEYSSNKDAVMPYQRCILVKLDKIEFTSVNFIEQN